MLVPEGKSPHCYPLQGLVSRVDFTDKGDAHSRPRVGRAGGNCRVFLLDDS